MRSAKGLDGRDIPRQRINPVSDSQRLRDSVDASRSRGIIKHHSFLVSGEYYVQSTPLGGPLVSSSNPGHMFSAQRHDAMVLIWASSL